MRVICSLFLLMLFVSRAQATSTYDSCGFDQIAIDRKVRQQVDEHRELWEVRREGKLGFYSRAMASMRAKMKRWLMPSGDTFPWYYVSDSDETAGVLRKLSDDLYKRANNKPQTAKEKEIDPLPVVERWIREYKDHDAALNKKIEDGVIALFNERQYAQLQQEGLSLSDPHEIWIAQRAASGGIEYKKIVAFGDEVGPYKARAKETRMDILGRQFGDYWFNGGLIDVEIKHAELYRKLTYFKRRAIKAKMFLADNGQALPEKVQTLLNDVDTLLADKILQPTDQSLAALEKHELGAQYANMFTSQQTRDAALSKSVFYSLLKPDNLTELGFFKPLRNTWLMKSLLDRRSGLGFFILGAGGAGVGLKELYDWMRALAVPENVCAEIESNAEFNKCVMRFVKRKFPLEYRRTMSDPSYQPFDPSNVKEYSADLKKYVQSFWDKRKIEFDKRSKIKKFQKPGIDILKELENEYQGKNLKPEVKEILETLRSRDLFDGAVLSQVMFSNPQRADKVMMFLLDKDELTVEQKAEFLKVLEEIRAEYQVWAYSRDRVLRYDGVKKQSTSNAEALSKQVQTEGTKQP